MMPTRRDLLTVPLMLAVLALSPARAASESMHVLKASGCGCCLAWIKYLEAAGFTVTAENLPMGALMKEKLDAGLKVGMTACHTGKIGGYIVEGHVPAREIRRLLAEQPDAVGLSVPNMPLGSPGMEYDEPEPYQVLLVRRDGTTLTYASYPS